MNLRRSLSSRVFAGILAVLMVGFFGYLVSRQFTAGVPVSGRLYFGMVSFGLLVLAGGFLWYALRRFRVGVDRDGWTVRIGRYRWEPRWGEISAVVIQNRETKVRGHLVPVPAVYLVPEAGVSLDVPSELRATVDGRPAVWLVDLDDLNIAKRQFVRDLASLAGERLEVRVYPLGFELLSEDFRERVDRGAREWLSGRTLAAFPAGVAGVRTRRWLGRRRFLLFVGWYLFAVLPALLLTGFAARLHEGLGAAVAVLGLVAVIAAYARFVPLGDRAGDLVDDRYAIFGTELVRGIGDRNRRDDMHAGRAVVLPPGAKRGYGKAWLLGFPHAVVLLGDPRTGRLRDRDDLSVLSAVLRESPHEADRLAARDIDHLAVQSQLGDPMEPGDAGNARLWMSLTKAGRVLAWAVVVGSVLLGGGWMVESTRYLGAALIFVSVPLATVWAAYALYRILALFSAGRTHFLRGPTSRR